MTKKGTPSSKRWWLRLLYPVSLRVGSSPNGMQYPHERVDCYNAGLSTLIFKRVIFFKDSRTLYISQPGQRSKGTGVWKWGETWALIKGGVYICLRVGLLVFAPSSANFVENYNKEQMSDVVIFTDVIWPAVLSIRNGKLSIYWKKFQWIHQKYGLMYFLAQWLWNVPSLLSDISTLWKESVEVFYWATDDHIERTFLKLLLHAAIHKVSYSNIILKCAFQNVVNQLICQRWFISLTISETLRWFSLTALFHFFQSILSNALKDSCVMHFFSSSRHAQNIPKQSSNDRFGLSAAYFEGIPAHEIFQPSEVTSKVLRRLQAKEKEMYKWDSGQTMWNQRLLCLHFFSETCLHHDILDRAIALNEPAVTKADRAQGSRGTRSGGLCVYNTDDGAHAQSKWLHSDSLIMCFVVISLRSCCCCLQLQQIQMMHFVFMNICV